MCQRDRGKTLGNLLQGKQGPGPEGREAGYAFLQSGNPENTRRLGEKASCGPARLPPALLPLCKLRRAQVFHEAASLGLAHP